jgi:hypothetical protein
MARIELKNSPLYIRDGLSGTGAVNNTGGYGAAATDMLIDTIVLNTTVTDQVPVGARFTVAGETGSPEHTVTDRDPNSGTTLNILFTPGLASSVADAAVITFLPHLLYIQIGEGNVTFTETVERIYDLDRGLLDTVRNGDEQPLELNLEFTYVYVTSETNQVVTPVDALKQLADAAEWVSSDTDQCAPYAVNIELRHCVPCGTDQDEKLVFTDFRYETLEYDLQEATIAVSGRCNVTDAVASRLASLDCPVTNPIDIT